MEELFEKIFEKRSEYITSDMNSQLKEKRNILNQTISLMIEIKEKAFTWLDLHSYLSRMHPDSYAEDDFWWKNVRRVLTDEPYYQKIIAQLK